MLRGGDGAARGALAAHGEPQQLRHADDAAAARQQPAAAYSAAAGQPYAAAAALQFSSFFELSFQIILFFVII